LLTDKIKILIVEDDLNSAHLLRRVLVKANYDVFTAENGKIALDLINRGNEYDAILTDWMMPEMNGMELLQMIRKRTSNPPVVIIITAIDSREGRARALELGADDYIPKPITPSDVVLRLDLCLNKRKIGSKTYASVGAKRKGFDDFMGVGIAASTGGPQTLMTLFEGLDATPHAAYFIVLHGPAWMLEQFPKRLQAVSALKVVLGAERMPIEPGVAYLSPGDTHMIVDKEAMCIRLIDTPPENFVKPSADPLFRSIANTFGQNSLSVVLTGMGYDGTIGSGFIAAAGGKVIAQDPSTAIIESMPESVIKRRIASMVVPLDLMAGKINSFIESKKKIR